MEKEFSRGQSRSERAAALPTTKIDMLAYLGLAAASTWFFFTMPQHGEFWWSESPRNALNGAFIRDLVLAFPIKDPVGWAYDYYLRFPALTILFYPPLLHAVLGIFFLLFGVSHVAAAACLATFAFAFACGVYALARRFTGGAAALVVALLAIVAPQVLTWGRQIMLEVPMLALMAWGAWWFLRYLESARGRDLAIAAALMVAAMYTKQTSLIMVVGAGITLLLVEGTGAFKRPHVWIVATLAAVALVPLAFLQLKFGAFNVVSVVERIDLPVDRMSWNGISWYAVRLFAMFGMLAPLAVAACVRLASPKRVMRPDVVLHAATFIIGYAMLTAIALKEERHGMVLLIPVAVAAAAFLDWIAGKLRHPALPVSMAAGGVAWFAFVLVTTPPPIVQGYAEAADYVMARIGPQDRVMFVGNRDGAFIFNIRERGFPTGPTVVRGDKIFLNIAIMPDLGLNEKRMAREQVAKIISDLGISHVVTVPNMWHEAEVMRHLTEVLNSPQFERLERFAVTGNAEEKELIVYRNLATLPDPPPPLTADIPAVGLSIKR